MPTQHLTACAQCDLLLEDQSAQVACKLLCPRCGYVLHEGKPSSVLRALLLSSIGLCLLGPATGLPLMVLSMAGIHTELSVVQGILHLANSGFPYVAGLVTVLTLLAPFVSLWLLFAASLTLHLGHRSAWLPVLLRVNHHVREWAMLEVFLFSALVAMVKLRDMVSLLPGSGLWCFSVLMVTTLLIRSSVDEHEFWLAWEKLQKRR